ncbi:sensor domain-containing diguanylate cyclase [[Enterobacter] lignolyticus]|uniref:diguanylate cyclase n=1 Tax=Enterobacter lignolyticus (strain SCF1) TaxID=701347 RepID=E3GA95_ENTLS|nr:sensor domain-containing diguanylate cyclase [[Enterobacter] lignolyticus]ADO47631.1 diguanylate cyclase [[Enterobacter] lignolyticus SCF1]
MLGEKNISFYNRLSLRAKQGLLLILVILQAMLLVGYLVYQYTYIKGEAARILRNTTLLEAENFEITQDAMRYQIRVIGNAILLNHTVTPENATSFLEEELKREWLDGVVVFNDKGDFVASCALFPLKKVFSETTLAELSFRERPLFKNLRLKEENDRLLYWQSKGTDLNMHGFVMYHAVRDLTGRFLGGVLGYFDSRSMIEMFRKLERKGFYLGAGGAMAVLDRSNRIQLTRVGAGTDQELPHFNPYLSQVMQYAADSARAHEYRSPVDGTPRMGVFLNLSNHEWVMAVGLAEHEILYGWYIQVLCSIIALVVMATTQWLLLNYMHTNFLQRQQLIQEAMYDALTGLANRRHFNERVQWACRTAQRKRQPLSVLSIDLDHFKRINDYYGHSVGDEVLRCIGQLLPGLVREGDIIARVGGEEFVVVMLSTELEEAGVVAEHIRASFANQSIDFHGRKIQFTASFGLTQIMPDELDVSDGIKVALDRADRGLYRAKREGRNRVCRVDKD